MMKPIQGLHHITAVAGDPQVNVDFYQQVLGQRLIKTTINFDDPGTYHLYYGDQVGTPGTALTFFPWLTMPPGRIGSGETSAVAYAIRPEALAFWVELLAGLGIKARQEERFGEHLLSFPDPDGMPVELVGARRPAAISHWQAGPVEAECALLGFYGVTLLLSEIEPTAALLREQLGYTPAGQEGQRYRYTAAGSERGLVVDLLQRPGYPRGQFGSGSVHHIAFRVADDSEQLEYRAALLDAGQRVTPVRDRQYFHSIYFREPGGVLFELATDGPGFLIDETVETLGSSLKLPPWLEGQRGQIEGILPELRK